MEILGSHILILK